MGKLQGLTILHGLHRTKMDSPLLWIKAPLSTRYVPASFVVYGVGFALLAAGGGLAVMGIFLNGLGAALLWQTVRATVIRDFPEQYRGRFSGMLTAVESVATAIGVALILNVAVISGYTVTFIGAAALTLMAIVPMVVVLRILPSQAQKIR